jgi:hypothetical protein
VFTLDIQRTDFYNDQLYCFYAAEGGINHWKEGLLIEPDIAEALTYAPPSNFGDWFTEGIITVEDTLAHQGVQSIHQYDESSPQATKVWRIFEETEIGAVGAWMQRNSTSAGDYDIYLYQDTTAAGDSALACVGGLGRDGEFHYWNGDFVTTGIPWENDTWYLVTIFFDATQRLFDFVVLDESYTELVRVEGIAFGDTASYIDKAMLYTSMHFIGDGYTDDFRIWKWCGDEPVIVIVSTGEPGVTPALSTLHQNYPNPFNPITSIEFDLPKKAHTSLKIYDVSGRLIRSIVDGKLDAGSHRYKWDGKDNRGKIVASGIYFYRLKAGSFSDTRKMVLLR